MIMIQLFLTLYFVKVVHKHTSRAKRRLELWVVSRHLSLVETKVVHEHNLIYSTSYMIFCIPLEFRKDLNKGLSQNTIF
jgi:hypothetical protein